MSFERGEWMLLLRYVIMRFLFMIFALFMIMSLLFISTRIAHLHVWAGYLEFPDNFIFVKNEYVTFLKDVFTRWDWGNVQGDSVWNALVENAPNTIKLNLLAFCIYFPVGIYIGYTTASNAHSLLDKIVNGVLLVMGSIPNYIWLFIFILLFSYTLTILPPQPPSVQTPLYWRLLGWVMPLTALSLAPIAKFAALMRSEILENLNADYLLLLRTKGLSRKRILRKHLVRDSIIPIMPEIAPTFVFVVVGSFFVERIYNMQGTATLLFRSMFRPGVGSYYIAIHTPMVVLISTFYALFTLLFIFFIDIIYAIIDPRIRVGEKR